MRGTRILLVRHGNTTWDKRVDALLDPPLDHDGVERLKRTREWLEENDLLPTRIISSPLQRTVKAALMISDGQARLSTNTRALPWNLGDYMGKLASRVDKSIQFLLDYPDLKAPHGEAYRTFFDRWTSLLHEGMIWAELMPEDLLMFVTHSRNINALQEYIDGRPLGDVVEKTPEASVTLLAKTGLDGWSHDIIWEGN